VETESQAAFLKACGCPTAQGYLYSKPQPAVDFEKWLRERLRGGGVQAARSSRNEALRVMGHC